MDEDEIFNYLEELHGILQYKNATNYMSTDWRHKEHLSIYPVQRQLGPRECVFDLDHLSEFHFTAIPNWLADMDFKFSAWRTSASGMHIHFITQIIGKERKRELVRLLARQIEDKFGVKNDLGPMGHGIIRMEFGVHPVKKTVKTFITKTCGTLFAENTLPADILDRLELEPPKTGGKVGEINGKTPTCVRYMLSHKFADGRERMLFALASWFKSSGKSPEEAHKILWEWCKNQDYNVSSRNLWYKIKSSGGKVGCRYRHELLEELGVDMSKCRWE